MFAEPTFPELAGVSWAARLCSKAGGKMAQKHFSAVSGQRRCRGCHQIFARTPPEGRGLLYAGRRFSMGLYLWRPLPDGKTPFGKKRPLARCCRTRRRSRFGDIGAPGTASVNPRGSRRLSWRNRVQGEAGPFVFQIIRTLKSGGIAVRIVPARCWSWNEVADRHVPYGTVSCLAPLQC